MIVGLMGAYCAGKDAAARVFEARGFTVIDVDKVGHQVLAEKAGEVISAFGAGVSAPDGRVDRRALGSIVFADPGKLARLEGMVHPLMVERVSALAGAASKDVVINAAILFKMGLDSLCDAVFEITSPWPLRLARAMRRDGLSLREAFHRVFAKGSGGPKSYGSAVDTYYVRNRGSVGSLERSVRTALERLQRGKAR